jgi:hypothetical protein
MIEAVEEVGAVPTLGGREGDFGPGVRWHLDDFLQGRQSRQPI